MGLEDITKVSGTNWHQPNPLESQSKEELMFTVALQSLVHKKTRELFKKKIAQQHQEIKKFEERLFTYESNSALLLDGMLQLNEQVKVYQELIDLLKKSEKQHEETVKENNQQIDFLDKKVDSLRAQYGLVMGFQDVIGFLASTIALIFKTIVLSPYYLYKKIEDGLYIATIKV